MALVVFESKLQFISAFRTILALEETSCLLHGQYGPMIGMTEIYVTAAQTVFVEKYQWGVYLCQAYMKN